MLLPWTPAAMYASVQLCMHLSQSWKQHATGDVITVKHANAKLHDIS